MLDIKFIRKNPEKVKKGAKNKGYDVDVDLILKLDEEKRRILREIEKIRAEKNRGSREILRLREKEKEKRIFELRKLDEKEEKLGEKQKKIDQKLTELLYQIPNLPLEEVPIGKSELENIVLREIGEKTKFDFKPKSYLEIGEKLDLIDVKRAAKVSGTRFGYLKREAVLIEFAIVNFVFEKLTKRGFIPVIPPVMMRSEMVRGMGYIEQLDKKEAYYLPKDNLYLAGTAEQPIGAMHANEIFEENDLPRRYVGFSTCFRREAGSYGKDTKGIFRVHQFDKIEMFSFCHPQKSKKEHLFFLSLEEEMMQDLKLPYRVVQMCTGDLGFPTAAKYDIEAWLPSEGRYRETHSTSNCTDFQARRLNIRYRDSKTKKLEFVHTINGTAFAIGRILIAIIENYQQKDGSVKIPEVLQKYLHFKEIRR